MRLPRLITVDRLAAENVPVADLLEAKKSSDAALVELFKPGYIGPPAARGAHSENRTARMRAVCAHARLSKLNLYKHHFILTHHSHSRLQPRLFVWP